MWLKKVYTPIFQFCHDDLSCQAPESHAYSNQTNTAIIFWQGYKFGTIENWTDHAWDYALQYNVIHKVHQTVKEGSRLAPKLLSCKIFEVLWQPSWPPPDPWQNDLMAIFMSSEVTTKQSSPSGGGGRIDPWRGLGCFSFNLAMVSALAGNTLSFDDVTLTAPRMSATDNFIAKCLAIVGNFPFELLMSLLSAGTTSPVVKVWIWRLTTDAKDFDFFPPLLGLAQQCPGNWNNFIHALLSLDSRTSSRAEVSATFAWGRLAFGILLIVAWPENISDGSRRAPFCAAACDADCEYFEAALQIKIESLVSCVTRFYRYKVVALGRGPGRFWMVNLHLKSHQTMLVGKSSLMRLGEKSPLKLLNKQYFHLI